jgi:CheY-like chemotaxis protein
LLESVERLLEASLRRRRPNRDDEAEKLRGLGNLAGGIAEQISAPVASLADSLKLAQRQSVELEKRLSGADAFSVIGIRQLLQTAERSAERVQAVLAGIATFAEIALHAPSGRRRVLIAHSEPRLVRLLHEALHRDYDLVMVSSGMEAQRALVDGGFDAFLCELELPDMHGIDLFERLLVDKPEQACRTVFVNSGSGFGERERAFFARHRPPQLRAPFKACDLRELIEAQWRALH